MLLDVVSVRFLDAKKVFVWNALLVGTVAFFYVLLEFIYGSMQIDENIGLNQLLVHDLEQPLVEPELVFGKIDLGEEEALGEEIV